MSEWKPSYAPWRHGGWYVEDVRYPSGAVGCVSRNYPDRKWRIVCDERPHAYELYTYRSRGEAALAEREIAAAECAAEPLCACGHYAARHVYGGTTACNVGGCECTDYQADDGGDDAYLDTFIPRSGTSRIGDIF